MDAELAKIVTDLAEDFVTRAKPVVLEDIKKAAPCVNTMAIPRSISALPGFRVEGNVYIIDFCQDASGDAAHGPIINNPPEFIESKTVRGPNGGGILSDGPGGSFFVQAEIGKKARVRASQKHKGWWTDFRWGESFQEALRTQRIR